MRLKRILNISFLHSPHDISPGLYWLGIFLTMFFAVSIGLQVTFSLIMAFGPLAERPPKDELSLMGRWMLRPEYDMHAYYVGVAFSLILVYILVWLWCRHLNYSRSKNPWRLALSSSLIQLLMASVNLVIYFKVMYSIVETIGRDRRLPASSSYALFKPAAVVLSIAILYYILYFSVEKIRQIRQQKNAGSSVSVSKNL